MTQTNFDLDKILSNPSFRNGVHLLGTLIFGYILLRLLLLFLDATHIGSSWLQTHQNSGLVIIIFILIFSLLVLDLAISMGRRHYNDEKYSIVEVGASYVKEKTAGIKSRSIEPDTGLTKSDVSSLSGMIGTFEKDDFMKKPLKANPLLKHFGMDLTFDDKEKAAASPSKLETGTEMPELEPAHTEPKEEITKPLVFEQFSNGKKSVTPETKRIEKPGNQPLVSAVPKHSNLKIEKPTRLGDLVSNSKLTQEPETNIKYKDVIPVTLSYGRRIMKSIDSQHCISVVDFKSKVDKDDAELKIELLKRSSRLATPIISKHKMVYESINIWVNVSEDDIEAPSIRFKINRNWVDSNNILTVQLQQYINGTWNIIPTKRISQDSNHIFYEAYITKISAPFAVVGTA